MSTNNLPTRRFSWDGVSFLAPGDWNLSHYESGSGASSVRMEDDEAVRLEMEWTFPPRPIAAARVRERHAAATQALSKTARNMREVAELPAGWSALAGDMPDRSVFVLAFRLAPDRLFFCVLRLYFPGARRSGALPVTRLIVSSLETYAQGMIPWDFYDVSFRLSRDFRLASTALEAGRKLLVFEWKLRRLFLWHFSLADLLLREKSLPEWATEFLNGRRDLRGVAFHAGDGGAVAARRRRFAPLPYEEIGRMCFRYRVACRRLEDRNAVVLTVFNYRRETDLKKLEGSSLLPAGSTAT